jgi:hypothetical protein
MPVCFFNSTRPLTLNPPKKTVAAQINIPITAICFCLLKIKLNTEKKQEAIEMETNRIFMVSPVYMALNSGEVSNSGNMKQNTARNDNEARKIEIAPLIRPSPNGNRGILIFWIYINSVKIHNLGHEVLLK